MRDDAHGEPTTDELMKLALDGASDSDCDRSTEPVLSAVREISRALTKAILGILCLRRSLMPKPEVRLLTVQDVAARCQISVKTIYRAVNAGDLRALKVGHGLRFREEDVEHFERDRDDYNHSNAAPHVRGPAHDDQGANAGEASRPPLGGRVPRRDQ